MATPEYDKLKNLSNELGNLYMGALGGKVKVNEIKDKYIGIAARYQGASDLKAVESFMDNNDYLQMMQAITILQANPLSPKAEDGLKKAKQSFIKPLVRYAGFVGKDEGTELGIALGSKEKEMLTEMELTQRVLNKLFGQTDSLEGLMQE